MKELAEGSARARDLDELKWMQIAKDLGTKIVKRKGNKEPRTTFTNLKHNVHLHVG
jgi:hypothetical protein